MGRGIRPIMRRSIITMMNARITSGRRVTRLSLRLISSKLGILYVSLLSDPFPTTSQLPQSVIK